MNHASALKSLQREHKKHLEREKVLSEILDTLRAGYNPNYQDMAVLEAVRGWEHFAGLPSLNDRDQDKEKDETTEAAEEKKKEEEAEVLDEGEWTAEELEKDLEELLDTDYVSLLLEHDEHVKSPPASASLREYIVSCISIYILNFMFDLVFDPTAYLPDAFIPQFEDLKDTVIGWLETMGIIQGEEDDTSGLL